MTVVHFHLHVKFRAFGITFGQADWTPDLPLPVPIPPIAKVTLVNDRGVLLEAWIS